MLILGADEEDAEDGPVDLLGSVEDEDEAAPEVDGPETTPEVAPILDPAGPSIFGSLSMASSKFFGISDSGRKGTLSSWILRQFSLRLMSI